MSLCSTYVYPYMAIYIYLFIICKLISLYETILRTILLLLYVKSFRCVQDDVYYFYHKPTNLKPHNILTNHCTFLI